MVQKLKHVLKCELLLGDSYSDNSAIIVASVLSNVFDPWTHGGGLSG